MSEEERPSAGDTARAGMNILLGLIAIVVVLLFVSLLAAATITPLDNQFHAEQTATAQAFPYGD